MKLVHVLLLASAAAASLVFACASCATCCALPPVTVASAPADASADASESGVDGSADAAECEVDFDAPMPASTLVRLPPAPPDAGPPCAEQTEVVRATIILRRLCAQ